MAYLHFIQDKLILARASGMIGNGVTVWGNQGPKVFESGSFLKFLAIDAYSAIGLGATFKVLRLCIIYFGPVFT